jgi:hypothetical protein
MAGENTPLTNILLDKSTQPACSASQGHYPEVDYWRAEGAPCDWKTEGGAIAAGGALMSGGCAGNVGKPADEDIGPSMVGAGVGGVGAGIRPSSTLGSGRPGSG